MRASSNDIIFILEKVHRFHHFSTTVVSGLLRCIPAPPAASMQLRGSAVLSWEDRQDTVLAFALTVQLAEPARL